MPQYLDGNAQTWWQNNRSLLGFNYDMIRHALVVRFLTAGQTPSTWLENLKMKDSDDILNHNDVFTAMIRSSKLYLNRDICDQDVVTKYLASLPVELSTRLLSSMGDKCSFSEYTDRARVIWHAVKMEKMGVLC